MCDFMEEFESVHSHFYSSAQSKLNIKRNIRRTRGNCTFQHQIWKKNLVYDFSNLLV